ncbi:MAG TPA: hypothetical protein VE650_05200 [Acetobacteraceae bacterium]|nr:hypothetical protein [Acetobacteraceae bacterium]
MTPLNALFHQAMTRPDGTVFIHDGVVVGYWVGPDRMAALGAILRDAKQLLADYKAPEQLLAVDAVPRNALGKIDRRAAATAMLGRVA